MNRMTIIWIVVIFAVALSTCKHESIEIPVQNFPFVPPIDTTPDSSANFNPCDPDTIYFERDVLPVLTSNCAKSGCHDQNSQNGNIILESYSSFMTGGKTIVIPFDSASSKMFKVISVTDSSDRMPQPPNPLLSKAEIDLIGLWIEQGAKDLSCDECDTFVSYTDNVAPLFFTNCKACHTENSLIVPNSNLWFVSTNPSSSADVKHATLASIGGSKLMSVLTSTVSSVVMPKPPNKKLDSCSIAIIDQWINAGMPNN